MYQNRENIKNLILYLVDLVSVFVSYFVANCIWLGLVKGYHILHRAELLDALGIVLFSFAIVVFIFNVTPATITISIIKKCIFKLSSVFHAVFMPHNAYLKLFISFLFFFNIFKFIFIYHFYFLLIL